MTRREIVSFVATPAALVLAAALALGSVVASGEDSKVRPAILVGDDLLRIFQEGKDAAEQAAPPEISLGTAFDPQQPPPIPSDYR